MIHEQEHKKDAQQLEQINKNILRSFSNLYVVLHCFITEAKEFHSEMQENLNVNLP